MTLDPYIEKHLDNYIRCHVTLDDAEAFRNYALALCETMDDPLEANWFRIYGHFISACTEVQNLKGKGK